jgi:hypothetical protein
VSFFNALKGWFSGTGQRGRTDGTDASNSSGSPGETAVAMIPCDEASA